MNSLPDSFGAAYLINLPERVDRLKSATRQFARAGWEMGPSGVDVFPALRYAESAGFPNAPIRGCFHSHLECLRLAYEKGLNSVLIVEDDIALSAALARLTSSIASRLAALEWDFVYFGHYGTGDIPAAVGDTNEGDLRFDLWTDAILTTYFYGVSGRILPRLIASLESIANGPHGDQEAGPMPIDGAYNIFRRNNRDVQCFIACPKLGWQTSSRSDITPHSLDRFIFLQPLIGITRKLKQLVHYWRMR